MQRPSELRAVCQAGKNSAPGWYVIHRRISIYVTWLFLRVNVPLGIVSLAMMGLGIAGAGLVASNRWAWNGVGFLLLYGSFLLDKVDGEVARYRGVQSMHGILLDRFHHRLVEPCLFFAVAFHEVRAGSPVALLGVGAAVALLGNLIEEQQHLTPYILLKHLREGGTVPSRRVKRHGSTAMTTAAALFRPLKMFRTFIVALPAYASCYAVEWWARWMAPTYYLYVSAVGLAIYLGFQCFYYYRAKLEDEVASIVASYSGLNSLAPIDLSAGAKSSGPALAASKDPVGALSDKISGPYRTEGVI